MTLEKILHRLRTDYSAPHWLLQFLIWLDQGLNLIVTPFSRSAWADETLSSRAYRASRDGKPFGFWRRVIDILFFWQRLPEGVNGHCHAAYLSERHRHQLPPEMRGDNPSTV